MCNPSPCERKSHMPTSHLSGLRDTGRSLFTKTWTYLSFLSLCFPPLPLTAGHRGSPPWKRMNVLSCSRSQRAGRRIRMCWASQGKKNEGLSEESCGIWCAGQPRPLSNCASISSPSVKLQCPNAAGGGPYTDRLWFPGQVCLALNLCSGTMYLVPCSQAFVPASTVDCLNVGNVRVMPSF